MDSILYSEYYDFLRWMFVTVGVSIGSTSKRHYVSHPLTRRRCLLAVLHILQPFLLPQPRNYFALCDRGNEKLCFARPNKNGIDSNVSWTWGLVVPGTVSHAAGKLRPREPNSRLATRSSQLSLDTRRGTFHYKHREINSASLRFCRPNINTNLSQDSSGSKPRGVPIDTLLFRRSLRQWHTINNGSCPATKWPPREIKTQPNVILNYGKRQFNEVLSRGDHPSSSACSSPAINGSRLHIHF